MARASRYFVRAGCAGRLTVGQANNQTAVVVGIATHNRANILRKAIWSACEQSYRPLRVAVIDDGSTDETPSLRAEFPDVSWERWDSVRGYVEARNRMMLGANEAYYVSLDDDAWFLRGDEIAIAVDFLERHPSAAAVAFDILSPDRPRPRDRATPESVSMFIGCGHVLRLSTVRALEGYCAFPGAYGAEEKDLCMRLIDVEHEIVKLNGVHVWHDKTVTARDRERQHRSGVCNDLTVALRRVPLAMLVPTLGYKLVSHLVFAVKTGVVRSCLAGMGDFAAAAGFDALRNRRAVRLSSFVRYQSLAKTPREIVE